MFVRGGLVALETALCGNSLVYLYTPLVRVLAAAVELLGLYKYLYLYMNTCTVSLVLDSHHWRWVFFFKNTSHAWRGSIRLAAGTIVITKTEQSILWSNQAHKIIDLTITIASRIEYASHAGITSSTPRHQYISHSSYLSFIVNRREDVHHSCFSGARYRATPSSRNGVYTCVCHHQGNGSE